MLQRRDGDTERRQDDHILRTETVDGVRIVGKKTDAHRPELLIDVRIVNDLAGQEHVAVGEAFARLIRVIDRPIDTVAEPEFTREMQRQPAGTKDEIVRLDPIDERTMVIVGQHAGDGMLQIEAFAED